MNSKLFINANYNVLDKLINKENLKITVLGKENNQLNLNVNSSSKISFIENPNKDHIYNCLRYGVDFIIFHNIEIKENEDIITAIECGCCVILLNCKVNNYIFKERLGKEFIVDFSPIVLQNQLEKF